MWRGNQLLYFSGTFRIRDLHQKVGTSSKGGRFIRCAAERKTGPQTATASSKDVICFVYYIPAHSVTARDAALSSCSYGTTSPDRLTNGRLYHIVGAHERHQCVRSKSLVPSHQGETENLYW